MSDETDHGDEAAPSPPSTPDMPVVKPRITAGGGLGRSTLEDRAGSPATSPRLTLSAARTTHRDLRPA